jgi:hypothetical protein
VHDGYASAALPLIESCLVCGLLLASEAGMQIGLPIQEPHLTKKFGRTAFCSSLKKGPG